MTVVDGIKTTIPLHLKILQDPDFIAGRIDTHFLERFAVDLQPHQGKEIFIREQFKNFGLIRWSSSRDVTLMLVTQTKIAPNSRIKMPKSVDIRILTLKKIYVPSLR
jgi:acetyl/propionyl-CoA carboxylase alpha subunit